ncbi:hypothetical protein I5F10_18430 [Proteus mirabilis]|nr:hypothetical protein [Proteus mirabilis]MBG6050145.1 hypothetical protein [Proteus mirabilis]
MKLSFSLLFFICAMASAHSSTSYSIHDSVSISLNLNDLNEKPSFSTSDLLAFIAICISLLTIYISFKTNRKNDEKSVLDLYWMREVIIPSFLSPFIDFHLNALKEFKSAATKGDFYTNFALLKINEIREKSRIISISDNNLKNKILEIIEDFEDEMYDVETEIDFEILLDSFSMKIVKEIQRSQIN